MRTDGQTDMTKLTVAFSNFAKAPKKTENVHEEDFLGIFHPKYLTVE